jgi:hypothetical protein
VAARRAPHPGRRRLNSSHARAADRRSLHFLVTDLRQQDRFSSGGSTCRRFCREVDSARLPPGLRFGARCSCGSCDRVQTGLNREERRHARRDQPRLRSRRLLGSASMVASPSMEASHG